MVEYVHENVRFQLHHTPFDDREYVILLQLNNIRQMEI